MRIPTLRLPLPSFFRPSFPAANRTARRLSLLLALLAPAAAAQMQTGDPQILFSSGKGRIAQLRAGDSLSVEIDGRQPNATYHFVLRDDKGTTIVHRTAKADGAGRAAARPLWWHSGVVGCEPCGAPPDAKKYRFRSYAEADAALDGHELEVAVFDEDGKLVTRRRLRVAATGEERPFFADSRSCPRFQFVVGEPVFLGFHNLDPAATERRFYLVSEPAIGIAPGDLLEDVRDPALYPQVLDVEDAGAYPLYLVWIPGSHDLGLYTGVVRDRPLGSPYLINSDRLLGPGDDRSAAGLSITVDSTGCPPG